MKKLLVLTDWFAPGYRAGGTITSCVHLCKALENDFEIRVLTGDRDLGDKYPYPEVKKSQWIPLNACSQIYYCPPERQTKANLHRIIASVNPDLIYLNSMFSLHFTIFPLWLKWQGKIQAKVILAPRGMVNKSALAFKSLKKKIFLSLFRTLGIHRHIVFHATDPTEVRSIRQQFGTKVQIEEVANFPTVPSKAKPLMPPGDICRFLFVGRIHPIKGLRDALLCVQSLKKAMELSIIGKLEDQQYWQKCQAIIAQLPKHIKVEYLGEKPPPSIKLLLSTHHYFILPTRGENFGHAIFEAMAAGRPVLISDQTPWKNLTEKRIGWDLSLSRPLKWVDALSIMIEMKPKDYLEMSERTWRHATHYVQKSNLKERYLELFQ